MPKRKSTRGRRGGVRQSESRPQGPDISKNTKENDKNVEASDEKKISEGENIIEEKKITVEETISDEEAVPEKRIRVEETISYEETVHEKKKVLAEENVMGEEKLLEKKIISAVEKVFEEEKIPEEKKNPEREKIFEEARTSKKQNKFEEDSNNPVNKKEPKDVTLKSVVCDEAKNDKIQQSEEIDYGVETPSESLSLHLKQSDDSLVPISSASEETVADKETDNGENLPVKNLTDEFEDVEDVEEAFFDKDSDDDIQYIDEEVTEEKDQELCDILGSPQDKPVSSRRNQKDENMEGNKYYNDPMLEENDLIEDNNFEEISDGSMDPLEQSEIIEAISDNEIIIDAVDQEKEKEKGRNETEDTLEQVFMATQSEMTDKVVAEDKDNDDISDASLCGDEDKGDLSLEEISDDEFDSSRKKNLSHTENLHVNKNKKKNTSDKEEKDNLDNSDNNSKNHPSGENEEKVENSLKKAKISQDHSNVNPKTEAHTSAAFYTNISTFSSKTTDGGKSSLHSSNLNFPLNTPTKDPPPSFSKQISVSTQTLPISRRGKIVQCNISHVSSSMHKTSTQDSEKSKLVEKYKDTLPASIADVFEEVTCASPPKLGFYQFTMGPVTHADIDNPEFRDISLKFVDKFHLCFNSKHQGIFTAQLEKQENVACLIRRLKQLELGTRYIVFSVVYRHGPDGTDNCLWKATIVYMYNQERYLESQKIVCDGKERAKLIVDSVPKAVSKDFIQLLFPESLYISPCAGPSVARSLSLGFSSYVTVQETSKYYDLLLVNGNRITVTTPDLVEDVPGTTQSDPGYTDENGIVMISDREIFNPQDSEMSGPENPKHIAPKPDLETYLQGIDGTQDQEHKNVEKPSGTDSTEVTVNEETTDVVEKECNEDTKSELSFNSFSYHGELDTASTSKDQMESPTSSSVLKGDGKMEGETKDTIGDGGIQGETTSGDKTGLGKELDLSAGVGAIDNQRRDGTNEGKKSNDTSQGLEVRQENELANEINKPSNDDHLGGESIISNSAPTSDIPTDGTHDLEIFNGVPSEEIPKHSEEEVKTQSENAKKDAHERLESNEEADNGEKNTSLEDVSDDEMINTELKQVVNVKDEDVIILKEDPSSQAIVEIDLTKELEGTESPSGSNILDSNRGQDRKKEKEKLNLTDGNFQVTLEAIDVDEPYDEPERVLYPRLTAENIPGIKDHHRSQEQKDREYPRHHMHTLRPGCRLFTRGGEIYVPKSKTKDRPTGFEYHKKDSATNYEQISPVRAKFSHDDSLVYETLASFRAHKPGREKSPERHDNYRREYRRSKSPSPRHEHGFERAAPQQHQRHTEHFQHSRQTYSKDIPHAYSYGHARVFSEWHVDPPDSNRRDSYPCGGGPYHKSWKDGYRPGRQSPDHLHGAYDNKHTTTGNLHSHLSEDRRTPKRYRRSQSRSLSPLSDQSLPSASVHSNSRKSRSKDHAARSISHSPISVSSQSHSLSPVSRSPTPQRFRSVYKSNRDRYSVVERNRQPRSFSNKLRDRSRSPYWTKSKAKSRSPPYRKDDRSPNYKRVALSPVTNRERTHDKHMATSASKSTHATWQSQNDKNRISSSVMGNQTKAKSSDMQSTSFGNYQQAPQANYGFSSAPVNYNIPVAFPQWASTTSSLSSSGYTAQQPTVFSTQMAPSQYNYGNMPPYTNSSAYSYQYNVPPPGGNNPHQMDHSNYNPYNPSVVQGAPPPQSLTMTAGAATGMPAKNQQESASKKWSMGSSAMVFQRILSSDNRGKK